MMNQNTKAKRNINFDLLRIIACMLVICCHVATVEIESGPIFTEKWISAHILNGIGHTGSILFLFLSGTLLLDDQYNFQPKKFYLNNFLKLLVAYQLWVIAYNVIGVIQRGNFETAYLKDIVINSIAGQAGYHFWYVPVLLGIYLILPMLRAICKASKWVPVYFVALFFAIQIVFNAILSFDFKYKYFVELLINRIPLTLVNHYVGYFVMGYVLYRFLKEEKIKRPAVCGGVFFIGGIIIGLSADLVLSVQSGTPVTTFNDIFTISSCFSAVGMFLLMNAKQITFREKWQRMVVTLSGLTFGVYMIHPLFMGAVITLWRYMDFLPRIILIPFLVIILFIISAIPIWIFSKIPIVNEWFVFCTKKKKGTVV